MSKLTKTEKRCMAYCESLKESGTRGICVQWKKSKTWGYNPHVMAYDESITSVS